MLIGSICAAIAICLLGGFLCFRYVRQTFDEVDHMLDQGYITQEQYDDAINDDVYTRIQEANFAIR